MVRRLIRRIAGPPPPAGASREQRLRWTRRLYRIHPAAIAACVILAIATHSPFLWALVALGALMWVGGLASITFSIRRERVRHD